MAGTGAGTGATAVHTTDTICANHSQDLLAKFVPSEDRICAKRKEDFWD